MDKVAYFRTGRGTRLAKNTLLVVMTVLITVWLIRALSSRSLPDISPWHRAALQSEFHANNYPDGIEFTRYLQLESKLAIELQQFVNSNLTEIQSQKAIRYLSGSPLNPLEYSPNWNWSFVLEHKNPRGSIVLVHGASDSPYSMRTLAQHMHQEGFSAIAVRLPGHGTLPGELANARVADWEAILTSAVNHARAMTGNDKPVYLAGYSMGGALAINYTLNALTDDSVGLPAGIVLLSPAIAITPLAAFANADLLMSKIPGFEKFAWNSITPEFDPYKYNSFPKQAGRQTYLLASSNKRRMERLKQTEVWTRLPPIISFMSAVDATVSVSAVVDSLYQSIQAPGSSLVVFGVNRTNEALGFLNDDYLSPIQSVQRDTNRRYDLTVVSNRDERSQEVSAITYCAENSCLRNVNLNLRWPNAVFSLSHVALPFPTNDPIYGAQPGPQSPGNFTLGSLQPRGERGVLVIPTEQLMRLRYNPFMPYLLGEVTRFCR